MGRFFILFFLVCHSSLLVADGIVGFWQTVNCDTGRPSSVIAIYTYQEECYGKLIATFNEDGTIYETMESPKSQATGVIGDPYLCGLDIVWGARPNKNSTRFSGYVVDPKKGKTYNAELWNKRGNLILRGKVFVFGKNITWLPFPQEKFSEDFKQPDLSALVPNIPQIKD